MRDNEVFTPIDLINAMTLSSVTNSFFGTNPAFTVYGSDKPISRDYSQATFVGFRTWRFCRERAGFEVRDVHYTRRWSFVSY